jgi:hypothetical protein
MDRFSKYYPIIQKISNKIMNFVALFNKRFGVPFYHNQCFLNNNTENIIMASIQKKNTQESLPFILSFIQYDEDFICLIYDYISDANDATLMIYLVFESCLESIYKQI